MVLIRLVDFDLYQEYNLLSILLVVCDMFSSNFVLVDVIGIVRYRRVWRVMYLISD